MQNALRRLAVSLVPFVLVVSACNDTAPTAPLAAPGVPSLVVTFDPETGLGFVGKGDVQSPFGWNNAVMQTHHTHIRFKFVEVQTVEQDCQVDTNDQPGPPNWVVVGTRVKTTAVGAEIAGSSRANGNQSQWVGWNLTGLGDAIEGEADWGPGPNNGCEAGTPVGQPRVTGSSGESLVAFDELHPAFGERTIWTSPTL